jgi:hypothetical protein
VSIQKPRADAEFSVLTVGHHLVLQSFALYWEMLPFCLFIGIPLLMLSRISASPTRQSGLDLLFAWLIVALLIIFLPEVSMYVTRRPSTLISRVRNGVCGNACGFGAPLGYSFASTA